jgi:hypothetical protein
LTLLGHTTLPCTPNVVLQRTTGTVLLAAEAVAAAPPVAANESRTAKMKAVRLIL